MSCECTVKHYAKGGWRCFKCWREFAPVTGTDEQPAPDASEEVLKIFTDYYYEED